MGWVLHTKLVGSVILPRDNLTLESRSLQVVSGQQWKKRVWIKMYYCTYLESDDICLSLVELKQCRYSSPIVQGKNVGK